MKISAGQKLFIQSFILLGLCIGSLLVKGQYNFQTIELTNELQEGGFTEIYSSDLGYLYIAGKETILQYDGKSLSPLHPNLQFDFAETRRIQELQDQSFYFLKNEHLMYGDRNGYSRELPVSKSINDFVLLNDKFILGTKDGILVFDPEINFIGVQSPFEELNGIQVNCLKKLKGKIIIGTDSGIWTYYPEKKELDFYQGTNEFPIHDLEVEESGHIWASNSEGHILHINIINDRITTYSNQNHFITDILNTASKIWFSTSNKGIILYDKNKETWSILDNNKGLPDQRILDMEMDYWGNLWFLSAGQKLIRFIDKDYIYYNLYSGLESEDIAAFSLNENYLFIAQGSKGVFRYDGNSFNAVSLPYSLINYRCTALLETGDALWIGTSGNGLVRIDQQEYTVLTETTGFPGNQINVITNDISQRTWIGTNKGLASVIIGDSSNLEITIIQDEQKLNPFWDITAVATPYKDFLIFGTRDGLIGIVNNERAQILYNLKNEINTIESVGNKIFIGTQGSGLFETALEKGRISEPVQITEESLELPLIIKALKYESNELWVGHSEGVSTFNPKNFSTLKTFSVQDGFPVKNINTNAIIFFKDKIWIGGRNGMIALGPLKDQPDIKGPKVYFSDIQIDYLKVEKDQNLMLGFRDHQISFNVNAVNIQDNREIQYAYLLEGKDEKWTPWTRNNNQSYVNLPTGKYNLRIRARSGYGEDYSEISKAFAVSGPIWKNSWFILGASLLFIALIYLSFRIRINTLKKRNTAEKARLKLQNRLLELEQKAHQLQMNPHFIFNALNSIQATVAKENYEMARVEISDFAQLMRSILTTSRAQMIPLTDEIKLLEKYINIEKKCRNLDFDYHIKVPDDLDPEEIMLPPMLVQPFIENAIIHGMQNIQHKGNLSIEFQTYKEGMLLCVIKDNGIGYDNNLKNKKSTTHQSIAISVTRERLENELSKEEYPVVSIKQLDHEKGGTEVKIKIPINYNY